jgi:hypothetical protein
MIDHLDWRMFDAEIIQTIWVQVIKAETDINHAVRSILSCFF